ncbi:MAG: FecR domain-containing protein [Candidatus Hydrogenedentes bacterium]|nr:FecR domain-containing protein [Candidatus Hydrogenedentota bacterium]
MARCSEIEQEIQAYIDGELERAKALIVEEHIASCNHCKTLFEEYRKINAILHEALYPYRLCESLDKKVMEKIPTKEDSYEKAHALTLRVKGEEEPSYFFTKVVPYFAVALMAVLGTFIFMRWPSIKELSPITIGYAVIVDGEGFLTSEGKPNKLTKGRPYQIKAGTSVETISQGLCIVGLNDATTIRLAQDTRIRVITERNIELEKGKVLCEVSRGSRLFKVHTAQGQITVFGTKFQVELMEGKLITTVISGEVKVETNSKFAVLKDNQQLVVRDKTISESVRECDAKLITNWANELTYPAILESRKINLNGVNLSQPISKVYVVPIDHKKISEIIVEWDMSVLSDSNYTIYVYDEALKPLLRYRLPKELMTQYRGSLTIPVPEEIKFEDMGLIHIEILSDDIDQPNSMPFTKVYAKS